jgi:multiple sugar transport system ATP-binding protein
LARLVLNGLTKVFPNGIKALSDFSLDIASGEFITIVGPSGCGKSTLLRLIAGLDEESAGSITLDGKELNGLAPKDRDMAVMFQNYALFPHLTIAENMGFGLKLRKISSADIRIQVEEVATTLGIVELLKRYPSELSGGQRQRAALGRAILRKPKLFLFDEPLSNLDAKMRSQMRIEISRLHQSLKATMIFVTHDQVEAMTMGNRVVVLKEGIIQQVAAPDILYEKPSNAFVASFIGSPGMNLFTGKMEKIHGKFSFEHALISLPIEHSMAQDLNPWVGKTLILGLRPEAIGSSIAIETAAAPKIKGVIGVLERLGGNVGLYFQAGKMEWAARVAEDKKWIAGMEIELPIDRSQAQFFDSITGQRLFN